MPGKTKAVATKATGRAGTASSNGAVPSKKGTKHVFKDSSGLYRWSLLSGNGQVVATAHEGYTRKAHCQKMMEQVLSGAYAHAPLNEG